MRVRQVPSIANHGFQSRLTHGRANLNFSHLGQGGLVGVAAGKTIGGLDRPRHHRRPRWSGGSYSGTRGRRKQ